MDKRAPTDWMIVKKKDHVEPKPSGDLSSDQAPGPRLIKTEIPAQGMWRDRDGLCYWRRLKILKYLVNSERYEGYWENTKEKVRLHRIFILFDDEDPREFAERFKKAYETRLMADCLLKYNFYVENMPTHQIQEVDSNSVNRILGMTQNSKALRGKSSSDTTALLSEVNFEFAKTMNKIIFDKHIDTNGPNLISGPLTLPEKPPSPEPPRFGMITIPKMADGKDFPKQFSEFTYKSIHNKDQSIRAMQEIRKECNDVLTKDIFNSNISKSMRVNEFLQIQKSSTSQISYYLKETWVNKIKDIVKTNFAEDPMTSQQFGKPWYSITETSKDVYEMGKLKKFLTQSKFVMQDSLLYMTEASVKRFVQAIIDFVPIGCEVKDSNTVVNTFYTEEQIKQMGAPKEKIPLFHIDLQLGEDGRPCYSTSAKETVQTILVIFQNGVKSLQEINQVEQKLLPHLFKSNQKMFLKAISLPDYRPEEPDANNKSELPDDRTWLFDEYNRLRESITQIIAPMEAYIETYAKYEKEYQFDPAKEMEQYDDPENWPDVETLRAQIVFHISEEKRINEEIPEEIICSVFKIATKVIRDNLAAKHRQIAQDTIELIAKIAKRDSIKLLADFDKYNEKVEAIPKNIEELSAIKDFMNSLPAELEKQSQAIKNCMKIYETLDQFQHKFEDEEEQDRMFLVFGAPKEVMERIEKQQGFLEKEKEKFVKQMESNKTDFSTQIMDLENLTSTFKQYQDAEAFEEVATMAKSIKQRIDEANEHAKMINNRESLVGQEEVSDYTSIQQMQKDFKPYFDLWTVVEQWRTSHNSWLNDPFDELDAQQVEDTVDTAHKTMAQTIRFFRDKDLPAILNIAQGIKDAVDEFKPQVPIVVALRTDGMQERHWTVLSTKVGFKVEPSEGFTFKNCMDMKLADYAEEVVDIGEKAGKEYNIEVSLAKMKTEWESIEFSLKPFKTTGTYTVAGFDDAMMILDEHIVLTQTMNFSPFKGPFLEEIEEWNDKMLYVSECIDEWMKCQGQWMYLQPIFDSPDIMKQLPSENKKFKAVDKNWKAQINACLENPNALHACTREGLLEKFQEANKNLDMVQRGLRDYLESKRSVFARFYFLSNDDLLEILSQTKEVENVRPHLRKVFENVMDITFERDKTISSMWSGEKEEVKFVTNVDPREKGVEFWMGEVEQMMYDSIRNVLKVSVDDYVVSPRTEWVLKHCGQCVLNGSQVHWTTEVEEAIQAGKLPEYLQKLEDQLLDCVQLVRAKLTKLQSITMGALITIDVHAKDVIRTLAEAKITDVNAFEWIQQLRYYWENKNCRVKCIQTDFPYCYEYLGNTFRLVITPLTDKCYMTLMGALNLNLGGAPAGPAGTGKTETTKDLAKALAVQCVVFNCSDGMDYIMIGKFFKGLSASGAWSCFDEFNRINLEVLSVIAQQLQQLLFAKANKLEEIVFEESLIKMRNTFCSFITMNPGYAGRSELPDNLKALFRPVAMMVPDYALIAQISLYSFGYSTATILSKKMVTTFKLNSEQLSAQDHYDYGMRAVKSVINAAGLLKRADPDMPENQLLLRALRDVNVPKFLKDDVPLFENIINDLFPGVERPKIDYGQLQKQIVESCEVLNKQPIQNFQDKIIQLYDTIQVRHGLMIVGPTGGGKSSNYKTLAHAMTSIRHLDKFEKVNYHILNPKSITMGQLYGDFDPQTTEWQDGVLAKIVQDCAKDESPEKHWIMFDGPVDAIWIENMNTVLDDNKKLCLNSGQIITLTDRMTMMFEVEDLAVASPATVSRCGMVYMEPGAIGSEPLIQSWLNTAPETFTKHSKTIMPALQGYFKKYLAEMLKFTRKKCLEPVVTVDNNLCQSLMRILDCFFADFIESETNKVTKEDIEDFAESTEHLFVFALTWSVGCTTNLEGREKFDKKLRSIVNPKLNIPDDGYIYDYMWNTKTKEWVVWTNTRPEFSVDAKLAYSEIVVPTFDSIRMQYLTKLLLLNKKHCLCPGPTGTGKTVNIQIMLQTMMPEEYQYIPITFSAQTSANQTQDGLDEKFEKRRKGIYGPPTGKRFVIFIDDLNMPKKETYGAQPPIELIRQWMDHNGWYDRTQKEKPFMKIEDIIVVSAMGPPGGGKNPITQRLQRHFNIMTYTNLGKESITMIFEKIVRAFIGSFSEKVSSAVAQLVDSTQAVYNGVADTLKPTPSKSHYTFNLRDISKIFQGVCSASNKHTQEVVALVRLWVHENQRVFGDRMINTQDKDLLVQLLMKEAEKFNLKKDQIFNVERIIFGDYAQGIDGEARPYIQIDDIAGMIAKIEEYLEDFNSTLKVPMKLVMFLDACDHVSRICRVLRQPMGHALLLGVGGSGRQSLCKLATYMSNFKLYQIEVVKGYAMRDWRDNLKTCLMQAGVEGKVTSFLFVDTQIINEQMLEDINNVLNSGDVPQLYKNEDYEGIYNVGKAACQAKGLLLNKMNMFGQYLINVRNNVHVVLAMSPLGDIFRQRLLKFPSLVNCCTLDWFSEWPEEALISVATGSVAEGDMDLGADQEGCIQMFKTIHQSVEKMREKYLDEARRITYVTPTSYLELLGTYKRTLAARTKQVGTAKNRLAKGLKVLAEASIEVAKLQKTLEDNQPELEKTKKITAEKNIIISKENEDAQEIKKVVAADEAVAAKEAAEVKAVKDSADADLAVALPALDEAVKAVKRINVNDFYELRGVGSPGQSIVDCFQVVLQFYPQHGKPKKNKNSERDPDGWWELAKAKLLSNPKAFLQELLNYDKDHIPDVIIAKVKPLMERETLSEARIRSASSALVAVRIWINAMVTYHEVLKIVNPKRAIAAEKDEQLKVVMAGLNEKRAQVKKIDDKLAAYAAELKELKDKEDALNAEIEDCEKRLYRADKMIGGLAGEKDRWTKTVADLTHQFELVVGDSLVAAGAVSYSGSFTSKYREELEQTWRDSMTELGIKHTDKVTMSKVLGDDVTIRMWGIAGLPSDKLSVENGIIMFKSRRWPLMIDPQTQANKFIKNLGKGVETGLDVFKQSESNLLRNLELAIQFGKWVLLENINENLDPALEPILLQQKIKQGSGYVIKLGDKQVSYNETFKFFLTTTIPNPHYSPETQVKVNLLNFAITQFGLEEQMLNMLVKLDFPDLAQQKDEIVQSNAENAKITYELENKILHTLSAAEQIMDLLSNDNLIDILADSKKVSDEIAEQKKISDIAEKQIDETREEFRVVAYRASLLYFCITDMEQIDPMYQYSLQWFQRLFSAAVKNSEQSTDAPTRIKCLIDFFTLSLYQNVCRSLFEIHKLLFSFLLCTKILFGDDQMNMSEWRFFLAGPSGQIDIKPNPTDWLDDLEWQQLYEQLFCLEKLECFKGIEAYFIEFHKKFKKIYDATEAHKEKMPGEWDERLNSFQKMILLKALRADKITVAIQDFIVEKIGQQFIEPPTFNLQACYKDSSNISPLIFVLSAGSDPIADFKKFAEAADMMSKIDMVSLGQGQAPKAERAIEKAKATGGWCLLQNCHLSISWMPKLEAIVEQLTEANNPEFRVWLTSMPSPHFPVSVLQTSVKMTLEPPTGLKSNLLRTYANLDNKMLNDCKKPAEFKKLMFAFSFFHAIVQDRRKFGPIGWNIPYAFTFEDFDVCRKQLQIFLDDYDVIDFKVLNILGAEVNYGGRVTDDKDIRLIKSILGRFVNEGALKIDNGFSDSGIYKTIEPGTQDDYIKYIHTLPLVPHPEAFGLHENAEITTNQAATRDLLANVLSVQPRTSSGGGKSREEIIAEISKGVEDKTPPVIDLDFVIEKYPTMYTESMNTVLTQEVIRYNKLLAVMATMLKDVQKALKGEIVMSEDLDALASSMFNNQVPAAFGKVGFLSLKPLASWINDLNERITFLTGWINDGMPAAYWISGFFFPQAFFTGAL